MKKRHILLGALGALVLVGGGSVLALRAGAGASDRAELEKRWADGPSRFVTVDGVRMHVREEGPAGAPVVVLLHGSIVNLHEWDGVAERLKDRYRVVRFDWSPYGLTGPDPSGVYSTPRSAQLMDGLMKQLGHDRFAVVATSNGSNVALEYNRAYPGHATAMAFSMLPLERPSQTRKVDPRLAWMLSFHKAVLPDWRSHWFWKLMLEDTTPPGFVPTDRMVDQIYDMNNLPGALGRQAQYIQANVKAFKTSDVGAVAETVRVPVLLQWCSYDDVISQGAKASVARFTHAPVELIEYPDLGHFPMWENPEKFTRDLKRWLDKVTPAPVPAAKA
ncbi:MULTISPECIES: alpha/beta hydrolase [unclassified Novosphingobium]|uniref:alpha/beta fold hydrolase n=1 Tax=unclassified Novosphingobium TaxID=2644732 RepID=UPI0006C8D46E|nr:MULTISPECIES: alpha/beta hydrolase [unclassified Novosphingobium]KPH61233.1 alpha/beta hydrolase [Novosphingobium sp. ST904]MPS68315.1 alpha/beta hydrolase [Novosphingobium sp.]TCM35360.1 pimeloyl-ACP methyl ester carboxylesterase [Novosphingobium sp. ST904]